MYANHDFQMFLNTALHAKTQAEIDKAFSEIYGKYPNVKFAISLEDYPTEYPFRGTDMRLLNGSKVVKPFLESNKIYFISDAIFENMYFKGEHQVMIDNLIMLDTNFSSYINSYINRKNIQNYQEVINIINQLLKKDVNFGFLYYLAENYKLVFNIVEQEHDINSFWLELNEHMRENLISLMLFRSIDREKFERTFDPTPTISREEAEKEAKELAYEFYYTADGEIIYQIKSRFLMTKIMLYKTVNLKFSSNKSIKNKTKQLIKFMIEDLRVYIPRELFLGIRYFDKNNLLPILDKLNVSKNFDSDKFNSRVDNISWDLMIPRFIEMLVSSGTPGDFLIPFFLTFDKSLSKLLDSYHAKIFVYDDRHSSVTTIPSWQTSTTIQSFMDEDTQKYFTPSAVRERRGGRVDLKKLECLLEQEKNNCLNSINKNS